MKLKLCIVFALVALAVCVVVTSMVDAAPQEKTAKKVAEKAKPAAAPAAAAKLKPGPEMAKLNFLLGTWSYSERYVASAFGPAGEGKGTMTCKLGPGEFSIVCDFRTVGSMGESIGHEVHSWVPKEKKYMTFSVGNGWPGVMTSTGEWQGGNLVFAGTMDIGPTPFSFRTQYREIKEKTMKYSIAFGAPGQPLEEILTGEATRKPAAAKQ